MTEAVPGRARRLLAGVAPWLLLVAGAGCRAVPPDAPTEVWGEVRPHDDVSEAPAAIRRVVLGEAGVFAVRNDGHGERWTPSGSGGLAPGGRVLAVDGTGRSLLLATETETLVGTTGADVPPRALGAARVWGALSAGGRRAALSDGDAGGIEIIDLDAGTRVVRLEPELPVRNGLALSGDGRRVAAAEGLHDAVGGHRTLIEVWSVDTGERLFRSDGAVTEHLGVWNVALSGDGTLLAADTQRGGESGAVVWSVDDATERLRVGPFQSYWARGLALSEDGALLAVGDEGGEVRAWRVADGRSVLRARVGQVVNAVGLSASGTRLAAGLWDSRLAVWSLAAR